MPISAQAWVSVSPIGLTTAGVTKPNNGAQYGPDTSGTTTCGIQEALNSLPTCDVYDGANNLVSGQRGKLFLAPGVFWTTTLITIPVGDIVIEGAGMSSWIPPNNIAATEDLGGTAIVGTSYATGLMTCPQDSHSRPATMLVLRDLDLRMTSPSSVQTSSTPAILTLNGWMSGEMKNVNILEAKTSGGIGQNLYRIFDCVAGGFKDTTTMMNVRAFGGNFAMHFTGAHMIGIGLTAGQTGTTISSFAGAIDIEQNLGCYWADLHAFSTKYGLRINTYFGRIYTPLVIYGIHFETCTHYLLNDVANMVGTVIIENPCWNVPGLNPVTDIPSTMPATTNVITKYEQDETGSTASRHITVAASSSTAGTSPYSYVGMPYARVFVITTVGGMTALTLDGQALFNGSFSVGQSIFVGAGHTLIATWATTAPVFELLPV